MIASIAIGLVLTSTAFGGGETCGTVNGDSFCTQLGKNGFADHLTFRNTGKGVISSFMLTFPSGTTVTGVAGNAGCHQASNTVDCTTGTKAGASQTVDAITNVGVGTKVTVTASSGAATASVTLALQATAEGTKTTVTTPPAACEADLAVTKHLLSKNTGNLREGAVMTVLAESEVYWAISVWNDSRDCTAKNVVFSDTLPPQFDCTAAQVGFNFEWHNTACSGNGRHLDVPLGNIPPHGHFQIAIDGVFAGTGKSSFYATSNIAYAKGDNAGEEQSRAVQVRVERHSKFVNP